MTDLARTPALTPPAIVRPDVSQLVRLDKAVDGAEGEGVRARWEFGRELLARREGKQLPNGLLDRLITETGKSRRELQYRVEFAQRFQTQDEVCNALHTYGSWHEIINRGLGRPAKEPVETPSLPAGQFATIVADPPWDVKTGPDAWGANAKSQALEYATMDTAAIAALPVAKHAANNAHLYLWTINAYLEDAYTIARAWGFEPSTLLTWCKAPHGLGLGGTYVLTTEFVLFARRGTLAANKRIDSSWFSWKRGAHSVKPTEFFDMVEDVSPGPYLEMFNRGGREDWTVWGSEAEGAA